MQVCFILSTPIFIKALSSFSYAILDGVLAPNV